MGPLTRVSRRRRDYHVKLQDLQEQEQEVARLWQILCPISDNETKDIEQLAEHMSFHNTPFSKGVIKGIITDMVECIRELTLGGTAVKLDNLAIFSVGITSQGAESGAAFSPAKHIKAYRLRARPTGKFNTHSLKTATHVQEQTEYQIQKKKKKTDPGTPQG